MYADDRVLVGVVKRKKDFQIACHDRWYRIPEGQMPNGINAEYIALFLSGKAFRERSGAIACFARITGVELARRAELLPDEMSRSNEIYYKIQFRDLIEKDPLIVNDTKRAFSFIRTTWDRFVSADSIPDLYCKADYLVDRVYYALRN